MLPPIYESESFESEKKVEQYYMFLKMIDLLRSMKFVKFMFILNLEENLFWCVYTPSVT